MGELDRANLARRASDNSNRMDEIAKIIEAYGKTLTQHKDSIDTVARGGKDNSAALDSLWVKVDAEHNRISDLEMKIMAIELRRSLDGGTFWRRLKWFFRGDSRVSTIR